MNRKIETVFFDYGGVLADEGFKTGIPVIAEKNSMNPDSFLNTAFKIVYTTGFTSGKVREESIWDELRKRTGIKNSNSEMRNEVLSRFKLRNWMINIVEKIKNSGIDVSILSDQAHWLDELNDRDNFFHHFTFVFNSYHVGLTKKKLDFFEYAVQKTGFKAENILFIDDHLPNIKRAEEAGLVTIYYENKDLFLTELDTYFPDI